MPLGAEPVLAVGGARTSSEWPSHARAGTAQSSGSVQEPTAGCESVVTALWLAVVLHEADGPVPCQDSMLQRRLRVAPALQGKEG